MHINIRHNAVIMYDKKIFIEKMKTEHFLQFIVLQNRCAIFIFLVPININGLLFYIRSRL